MRILLANYRQPFPAYVSGADRANHEMLVGLAQRGHTVLCLAHQRRSTLSEVATKLADMGVPASQEAHGVSYVLDGVPVRVADDTFVAQYNQTLRDYGPDVVFLANPLAPVNEALFFASGPWRFVYLVHSPDALEHFGPQRSAFAAVITVSRYMQARVRSVWGCEAHLVYPVPADLPPRRARSAGDAITMVNPVAVKGGGIVRALAAMLPERRFVLVEGWRHPERDGLDFTVLSNVTLRPPRLDVVSVYEGARILLVPSQWREAWGRVLYEAAWFGIPVIASKSGGIPEAFAGNGILVDHYRDVGPWLDAITALDEPRRYQICVEASAAVLARYSRVLQLDALEAILARH